jgi:hypothetical protein
MAETIRAACPSCGVACAVRPESRVKAVRCPSCGEPFRVPAPALAVLPDATPTPADDAFAGGGLKPLGGPADDAFAGVTPPAEAPAGRPGTLKPLAKTPAGSDDL